MESKAPNRRALKRGGSRIAADRLTWQLTAPQCWRIVNAAERAWDAGAPFNRFITASWGWVGCDDRASVRLTGEFIRLAREWHRERGFLMPWCWTQEWGPKFKAHAHILLHVPRDLDPLFKGRPRAWAAKVLGGRYSKGAILSRRFANADAVEAAPAAYEAELLGRAYYLLKCAPVALQGELGLIGRGTAEWGQRAPVYGRRASAFQPQIERLK